MAASSPAVAWAPREKSQPAKLLPTNRQATTPGWAEVRTCLRTKSCQTNISDIVVVPSDLEDLGDRGRGEVGRISDVILSRIVSGAYPSGLRLPAELDL